MCLQYDDGIMVKNNKNNNNKYISYFFSTQLSLFDGTKHIHTHKIVDFRIKTINWLIWLSLSKERCISFSLCFVFANSCAMSQHWLCVVWFWFVCKREIYQLTWDKIIFQSTIGCWMSLLFEVFFQ